MRLSRAGTYRHCAATPWPPSDVASQAPTLADAFIFFPVRTTVRWVDKPSDPGQSAGDPYNEFPVETLKSEWVFALEILGGRVTLVGATLPKDVPVLQMTPEIGLVFVRKVVVPRGAYRHRFAGCYSSPETKLAPQHSAATERRYDFYPVPAGSAMFLAQSDAPVWQRCRRAGTYTSLLAIHARCGVTTTTLCRRQRADPIIVGGLLCRQDDHALWFAYTNCGITTVQIPYPVIPQRK